MSRAALACMALLLGAAGLAAAQGSGTVYRCGDGRYSAQPCPDGRPLDGDARSAEQRRQAEDASRRDSELARQLAAERRQREQAARGQQAVRIGPAASAADAKASAPHHRKKPRKPVKADAPAPARAASAPQLGQR